MLDGVRRGVVAFCTASVLSAVCIVIGLIPQLFCRVVESRTKMAIPSSSTNSRIHTWRLFRISSVVAPTAAIHVLHQRGSQLTIPA